MSNYLQRRSAVYYFYRRVPSHLALNRNQILKWSLKTKCYNTAKFLADMINYEVSIGFIKGEVLTGKKFNKIIEKFEKKSLKEYGKLEELRHKNNTIIINNKTYEGSTAKAVLYHLNNLKTVDDYRDFDDIVKYVDSNVIQNTKWSKDETYNLKNCNFDEFYWRLFKQQKEALKQDAEKFLGNCNGSTVSELIENLNSYFTASKSMTTVAPQVVQSKTLVIEDNFETIMDNYIKRSFEEKRNKRSNRKRL